MKFTGNNLLMVWRGLRDARMWIHNEIASCPDVEHYASDIQELEADERAYDKLIARVEAALRKEGYTITTQEKP